MKKLLPKTAFTPQGFTLIELMVAITIVAVMSIAGIIVYTQVQQNARDAKRREDINAIATAIEAAKEPTSGNYVDVSSDSLVGGEFPIDPTGGSVSATSTYRYCYATSVTKTPPTTPTTWTDRTVCPSAYGKLNRTQVGGTSILSWKACALLERGVNPANIICRSNSQ